MCGRYNLIHDPAVWRLTRPIKVGKTAPFQPRYNIAPGQLVPVYREAGDGLELLDMTWGYVPHFITDNHPNVHPINARAESAFDKPFFRESMQKRRCLIPATGYYEWQARDGSKQPFHIHLTRQHPFLMAGIWDYLGDDKSQPTVAILTTKAPMDLGAIHDRMPVIIPNELIYNWFEHPDNRLLMPPSSGIFVADQISTRINNARNEGPGVLSETK
jgi:putative SOS response-associated peptidase YedK